MLRKCPLFASVVRMIRAVRSGPSHALLAAGRVTVLLFLLGSHKTSYGENSNGAASRVFEFRCEFWMPIASGRVDGLMACDGPRQRIAIYWMEPALLREAPSFLRCCDLIFDRDVVHYWIQGMSQLGTSYCSAGEKDPLLPRQKSPESILRSVLAMVDQIRSSCDEEHTPLELARFFETSRGQAECKHEARPAQAGPRLSSNDSLPDVQLLNALPFGREYSKRMEGDGSMIWRVQKGANGRPVATVTIQRLRELEQDASHAAFDLETLGRWTLIPEANRAYWSFDRALAETSVSTEGRRSARDLYGKLDSYLDQSKASPEVVLALHRLRVKAALMTTDSKCVWQAAHALVARLCSDGAAPKYQCLLDLGSLSGQIQKQYPERMEEQLRPLVTRVVRHGGQEARAGLSQLMGAITSNGWFTYGELLLAQMRHQGLLEERDADSWMVKLQASRLAKGGASSDSSDAPPSVRQYLSQLEASPPRGTLDWNDIQRILNDALANQFPEAQLEAKCAVVEQTLRSLGRIVGEGPFRGDREKLIGSLDRLSRRCLTDYPTEPIDTVLATFLALSFCDTSTAEDHDELCSQLHSFSAELQFQVTGMLADRGLDSLVTAQDVGAAFDLYEQIFLRYVDDPLWPPFKFPWTSNEETRLRGKMKLRLLELAPALDEVSLKVKYGGPSKELKDKAVRAISATAQELLPQAAFLRLPLYPGILCHYNDRYGFSVVIKGPFYQDGDRPKQRFQVMKYLHLGHRLEEVVTQERELTKPGRTQEPTNEKR